MIEAAYTDGKVDEIELNKIKFSLINVFNEDPEEVEIVIKEALKNKNNSRSLHNYTSFINKNFDDDKKLLLIEALWEIVLSDGEIHCFYEGENMLVIHPDECIDCGVCEPECPVEAILSDTEDGIEKWAEINRKYSEIWPNINIKKEPPADAEEWQNIKDKYIKHFSEKPGS